MASSLKYKHTLRRPWLPVLLLILITASVAVAQDRLLPSRQTLPVDLQDVTIVEERGPAAEGEAVGHIRNVIGTAIIWPAGSSQAHTASAGGALYRGDRIITLEGARLRGRFTTHDVVTMGQNSRVGITEFVADKRRKIKRTTFSMHRGKSMFYVMRSFQYKTVKAQLRTPRAVVGVRGTKYGADVTELENGIPAGHNDGGQDRGNQPASNGGGDQTGKADEVFFCFFGSVDVTAKGSKSTKTLTEGQSVNLSADGIGDALSTNLDTAVRFIAATHVPAPQNGDKSKDGPADQSDHSDDTGRNTSRDDKSGEDERQDDEEGTNNESRNKSAGDDTAGPEPKDENQPTDPVPQNSDVAQTQNTTTTEQGADTSTDKRSDTHYGYIINMITTENNGIKDDNSETYYRAETLQDFDSDHAEARAPEHTPSNPRRLIADGSDPDKPKISGLEPPSGSPIDQGLPADIVSEELGFNEFQEWGYWTQPEAMVDRSGTRYFFNNRGFYIFGEQTEDSQINDLASQNVTGTYKGEAHGTLFSAEGGVNLKGDFSAKVDLGAGKIGDFELHVAGGPDKVDISGADGTFRTNSPLSEFDIDPASGQWQINDTDADTKVANGSMFGPEAENIGGIWKVSATGTNNQQHQAAGMFQGDKQ